MPVKRDPKDDKVRTHQIMLQERDGTKPLTELYLDPDFANPMAIAVSIARRRDADLLLVARLDKDDSYMEKIFYCTDQESDSLETIQVELKE